MREKIHRVPPSDLRRARSLRKDTTFPERLLWSRLRAGRAGGIKFRRQVPLGNYIVDFYCPTAKLVVELDGKSHIGAAQRDTSRTAELERAGLRVIRFTNDDVIADVHTVAEAIVREARRNIHAATLPQPLPEKGGG